MINILICGTPGTGKSSLVERVRPRLVQFSFINVSKFALENDCIEEYDIQLETNVIDEDKLVEKLRPVLGDNKFNVIECIHGDILPSDLAHWVFVCKADTEKLFDRLKSRGYNEEKLNNNVEAEIFQTISEEAIEQFGSAIVTQLYNNEEPELDSNADIIVSKVEELMR